MRATEFTNPFPNSKVKVPVYHGSHEKFDKFNRAESGIFFTPHIEWAKGIYGPDVITCYINVPKLYKLTWDRPFDAKILDAFFDRDYEILPAYIQKLKSKGYSGMQSPTDSEMICVFDNAQIVNANTGKEM